MARGELLHWAVFGYLLAIRLAAADLAPLSEYEGRPISAVRFDPLRQPVAAAELARLLPFQTGAPLRLADVDAAIKRLFATGDYSNIEVDAEPDGNGLAVVIHTTPQWFVGPIEVHGKINSPPTAGHLSNATPLDMGAPFEDGDLERAARSLRELLQRNGLYRAQVQASLLRDAAHHEVAITFTVNSGKRARLTLPTVVGATRIPPPELARAAGYRGWFRWKPATAGNVQSGLQNIRKLYNKQDRLTAAVTLQRQDYLPQQNRVRPVIAADGGPRIKFITEGAHISKSKLETYIPVFDIESVNRDLLVNGASNLRDYFQDRGYFDAQVDFTTRDVNPDLRDITYTVVLGQRHTVVKVAIQGNHYFKTSDISERIYIRAAGFLILRHGRFSDALARRDSAAIEALYGENGFPDAKVAIIARDDYKGNKGDVAVTIDIREGKQSLVSSLDVEGITRKDRPTILALLASQPGQPYSTENIATDRNYLLELYQSAGYPDATFDYSAVPAGPDRTAVTYKIVEGQPRNVRDVLIYGLHTTRYSLIRRNLLLKAGDPLSWTAMGNTQRRLYNLGIFDKVDLAIQNEQGDTQNKYVLYQMVEGPRYSMAVGVGAEIAPIGGNPSSLDNPTGTTGFAPRGTFQISRLNLWGLGQTLTFAARYSTIDQLVSLTYLAPNLGDVRGRDLAVTGLYDNIRDVLTFTGRRIEGSVQLAQRHSKSIVFLWRYTWRDVQVDQNNLKIDPLLIPLASQPAHIAMISGAMVQDRRDNPVDPHRGVYNSLDLGLVDRYFGGDKNFVRFLGRNSIYRPLNRDVVLATNLEFGVIAPFHVPAGYNSFDYVPIPEHFFGGGENSMRGFPFNQAGPRDLMTGFPLGGNALLFQQTELRFPLIGANIGGVLFHDMGNIYTDVSSISFRVNQRNLQDFNYMVHAVGVGVRYHTPVGPLRVDLAYSINPPTFYGLQGTYQQLLFGGATSTIQNISHFQFFFSIGPAF